MLGTMLGTEKIKKKGIVPLPSHRADRGRTRTTQHPLGMSPPEHYPAYFKVPHLKWIINQNNFFRGNLE